LSIDFDFCCFNSILATASDKVYQLFSHGWRFSLGTSASSTTKTGRHDIAEILLKVVLSKSSAPFFVIYKAGCEPTPYQLV
jgi:hypothetical protein